MIFVEGNDPTQVQQMRVSPLGVQGLAMANGAYIVLPTYSPEKAVDDIAVPFPLFFRVAGAATFEFFPSQTEPSAVFVARKKFLLESVFVSETGQVRMSEKIAQDNLNCIGKTISLSPEVADGATADAF